MTCPKLLYAGSDDRANAALRHTRASLADAGATVVEFDGLDHQMCNGWKRKAAPAGAH
jgi:hypothetical protein